MTAGEAKERISTALENVKAVAEDETLPEGIQTTAINLQEDLEMLESELVDLDEAES